MFVLKNIDTQEYIAAFLSREAAVRVARKCEAEGMNVCLEFMTDIF